MSEQPSKDVNDIVHVFKNLRHEKRESVLESLMSQLTKDELEKVQNKSSEVLTVLAVKGKDEKYDLEKSSDLKCPTATSKTQNSSSVTDGLTAASSTFTDRRQSQRKRKANVKYKMYESAGISTGKQEEKFSKFEKQPEKYKKCILSPTVKKRGRPRKDNDKNISEDQNQTVEKHDNEINMASNIRVTRALANDNIQNNSNAALDGDVNDNNGKKRRGRPKKLCNTSDTDVDTPQSKVPVVEHMISTHGNPEVFIKVENDIEMESPKKVQSSLHSPMEVHERQSNTEFAANSDIIPRKRGRPRKTLLHANISLPQVNKVSSEKKAASIGDSESKGLDNLGNSAVEAADASNQTSTLNSGKVATRTLLKKRTSYEDSDETTSENHEEQIEDNRRELRSNKHTVLLQDPSEKSAKVIIEGEMSLQAQDKESLDAFIGKERTVVCRVCREDVNVSIFEDHVKSHEQLCEECGFITVWKNVMVKHIQNHEVEFDKLTCKYCNTRFKQSGAVLRHIKRAHPEHLSEYNVEKCPYCDEVYLPRNMKRHIDSWHKAEISINKTTTSGNCSDEVVSERPKETTTESIDNELVQVQTTTVKQEIEHANDDYELENSTSETGLCLVCNKNQAKGKTRNGIRTCHPCRVFFKNVIKGVTYVKRCRRSEKGFPCDPGDKPRCSYCAYQKCVDVGMVKRPDKQKSQCKICRHQVTNLSEHVRTAHRIRQCPFCPYRSQWRGQFSAHVAAHGGKTHTCNQCGATYNCSKTLLGHMRDRHSGIYKCSECSMTFDSRSTYRKHLQRHLLKRGIKPPSCDPEMLQIVLESLKNEIVEIENPIVDVIMKGDGFVFVKHESQKSETETSGHESQVTQDSNNSSHSAEDKSQVGDEHSQVSGESGDAAIEGENVTSDHVDATVEDGHSDAKGGETTNEDADLTTELEAAEVFSCDQCSYTSVFKEYLYAHCRNTHAPKKRKFKCTECSYITYHSSNLKRHIAQHGLAPKHKCPYCDKEYCDKSMLKAHIRDKHEEGPRPCPHCDAGPFTCKAGLQQHMHTKHSSAEDLKFICDECSQGFATQRLLNHHKKSHVLRPCNECGKPLSLNTKRHVCRIKDHKCEVCGRGFSNVVTLYKHLREKHNVVVSCEFCGKNFEKRTDLKAHRAMCESGPKTSRIWRRANGLMRPRRTKAEMEVQRNSQKHILGYQRQGQIMRKNLVYEFVIPNKVVSEPDVIPNAVVYEDDKVIEIHLENEDSVVAVDDMEMDVDTRHKSVVTMGADGELQVAAADGQALPEDFQEAVQAAELGQGEYVVIPGDEKGLYYLMPTEGVQETETLPTT